MKRSCSIVLILSLLVIAIHQAPAQSFAPASKRISPQEVENTVATLIGQMTLEEKIDLIGGNVVPSWFCIAFRHLDARDGELSLSQPGHKAAPWR
jgi:hypothetical protein